MANFTPEEYQAFHTALTDAYHSGTALTYNGVDIGILTLELFDAWHTLCWASFDYEYGDGDRKTAAQAIIQLRQTQGFVLPDLKRVANG